MLTDEVFFGPDEHPPTQSIRTVHDEVCALLCNDLVSIASGSHVPDYIRLVPILHRSASIPDRAITIAHRGESVLCCTILYKEGRVDQYAFHGFCAETSTIQGLYVAMPTPEMISTLLAQIGLKEEDMVRLERCRVATTDPHSNTTP
jgi:hypothetical protein